MKPYNAFEALILRIEMMSKELSENGKCPYDIMTASDQGFESLLKMLFEIEQNGRIESNLSVYEYIRTGSWPEQTPWARYITTLRVQCALDFVCQLCMNDSSGLKILLPSEVSDDVVLEWLLIDHWHRCFDTWLKLIAVSLFFSLPLYGLKPDQQ